MSKTKSKDSRIGVCVKSLDRKVEFQNNACKKICGEHHGIICNEGCMAQYNDGRREGVFQQGARLYKNSGLNHAFIDSVVINDGAKITTFLFDKKWAINDQLEALKKFNLTISEVNIMKYYLAGFTLLDISNRLFISKNTVKTHLNNIFKKIPEGLKRDIQLLHSYDAASEP